MVLVCRPGSFDPSKIKPSAPSKLTKKSRRRKPLKPKKRASRTSGECVTNPLLDTSGSGQGQSGMGTESDGEETNIDPLHVGVYDSADEENGKGDMDAECAIPGERLAVAMENTDEVQNKVRDTCKVAFFDLAKSQYLSISEMPSFFTLPHAIVHV